MDDTGKKPAPADNPASPPIAKKPYAKPAFICERAFETMALSCGKINSTQLACKLNRKRS